MPFFIIHLQFFDKRKNPNLFTVGMEFGFLGFSGNGVRVFFFAAEWTCMQNSFEHILQAGGMSDERTFRSEAAH